MAYFTQQEFEQMLFELVQSDAASYNTMIKIAEKTLYKSVCKWCNDSSNMRNCEDDVMQHIYLRLIKKCVTGFLIREGKLNDDPEGFQSWLFTVAKNIFKDLAKKENSKSLHETKTPEGEDPEPCGTLTDIYEDDYDYDALNRYFAVVLEADSKVHIPMTWISVMLTVIEYNASRIEATDAVIKICNGMTLDEMLDFILSVSGKIIWLNLKSEHIDALRAKLDEIDSDGKRTGDKAYNEFYMKKGAKASVSDWVNRMNSRIQREAESKNETPDN